MNLGSRINRFVDSATRGFEDSGISLGHFRHSQSWNLAQRIWRQHAWLNELFQLQDGLSLQPTSQPAAVTGLRSQWAWFRRESPLALVLLQVGREVMAFEAQAERLGQVLGCALDTPPRRPFRRSLSVPLKRLKALRYKLRQRGLAYLFASQQGYLRGGMKRRVLRLDWRPLQHPFEFTGLEHTS
ncbi:MAG: hypothetical protein ACXIUB_01345 [Wenzhouxiangella sp.]